MPHRVLVTLARRLAPALLLAAAPPVATPAELFGPLYRAVELGHVFPDSKTFADAIPRRAPAAILADYRARRPSGSALATFVRANFAMPSAPAPPPPVAAATRTPLATHIAATWTALTRPPVIAVPGGSALSLPRPFVVPGGRFREIYYWDSYFGMLGLARDRRGDLVESMIDDFTTLIERYGHIPNGTRSYYLGRSQPPVYFLMLALSKASDPAVLARRLAALRREHAYWMAGEADVKPGQAIAHVVRLPDGAVLNRYRDAGDTPRDESYAEDVATADKSMRLHADLWRDLRSGAESGWDYSSRWLTDPARLDTIRTTAIAPIDLNSLMVGMERAIAARCARAADTACARAYRTRAATRAATIRRTMWDARIGAFGDIEWASARPTGILTAASAFPLQAGIASADQARTSAATIRAKLLAPGGLRTTLARTGQQWDRPNGWAPLQWIAIEGLRRSGDPGLAREIARRWIATVAAHYRASGYLIEKYDVETGALARGGEYATQIGFGWTNGVTRALIADYGVPSPAPLSPR